MSGRRRGRSARDALLVLALGTLAIIADMAWLAEHVLILAGVALLIGAAYYLGRHGRRQVRPGQIQTRQARPEEPAAAGAMPAGTLPQADYDWDEPGTRQPASVPTGSDRDSLLADPLSGAHPLRRP